MVVEALSYHGLRMLTGFRGTALFPVQMDEEGVLPSALSDAIRKRKQLPDNDEAGNDYGPLLAASTLVVARLIIAFLCA